MGSVKPKLTLGGGGDAFRELDEARGPCWLNDAGLELFCGFIKRARRRGLQDGEAVSTTQRPDAEIRPLPCP
eukprot:4794415-Prymnesium_polylepis.1